MTKGGSGKGSSPGRTANDDRSDSKNPQAHAGQAAAANHSAQVAANRARDNDEDDE